MDTRKYYASIFPAELVCNLLGRAWRGSSSLYLREMAIETEGDFFMRHNAVCSAAELRELFDKRKVARLHVGAIYSDHPPHRRKGQTLVPIERELVFDIDVNDYALAGVDASDIAACDAAWPIVAFGIAVLHFMLMEKFGFHNFLLTYSGRRGAHLTVHDARACALTDEQRGALLACLQPSGQDGQRPKYGNMMSSVFLDDVWNRLVGPFWSGYMLMPRDDGGGGVLDSPADRDDFLELLGIDHAIKTLKLAGLVDGRSAWAALLNYAANSKFPQSTTRSLRECVLAHCWPRVDAAVTRRRDHLSKATFSVHGKTGRVCIPVFGNLSAFDPRKCPTAAGLVAGDAAQTLLFNRAVEGYARFADAIVTSGTEAWEKPSPRCELASVFPMRGSKRAREGPLELSLSTRACFNLERVFVLVAEFANPKLVRICWFTRPFMEDIEDSIGMAYAGYPAPYRAPRAFPMAEFVQAVSRAAAVPGVEVECAADYLCALLHDCDDEATAAARLDRMIGGLEERNKSAVVNSDWDTAAIESMVRSVVIPVWQVSSVVLS